MQPAAARVELASLRISGDAVVGKVTKSTKTRAQATAQRTLDGATNTAPPHRHTNWPVIKVANVVKVADAVKARAQATEHPTLNGATNSSPPHRHTNRPPGPPVGATFICYY